ncbi:Protein of unknown function [Lactobacillus helveticus CIRM-BIA 951]|uniref:Uncharacterized protein n=1 Tax=Lactobacillus helveticus CIRM-BIA 951 TaxID=1226334 RepID=U6F551_LACHE|nr:Protein of unknown function [Lactobacillus helveticus CIRM-BIA 951]
MQNREKNIERENGR